MALVLLPCEIFHREFDSKLILAARLASNYGHHVLIGYDKFFNLLNKYLPPSVLLDKSCSSILYNGRIKPVKDNNGKVIINDEEGFNNLAIDSFSRQGALARIYSPAVESIDSYLAWGNSDAEFFSQIPNLSSKISILGNCRSDLTNNIGKEYYKDTILGLNSCFNNFFLVSDNFCVERWNSTYKLPRLSADLSQNTKLQEAFEYRQQIASSRRHFFTETLTGAINNFPHINFIVRPHPMSNPLWWNQKFNKFRNVHVIYSDSVEPWIHASEGLISMGCTTSLQAALSGKPISEIKNTSFDLNNEVSFASRFINNSSSSLDELTRDLSSILNGTKLREDRLISSLRNVWVNTDKSSTATFAQTINHLSLDLDTHDFDKTRKILQSFRSSSTVNFKLNPEKWPYPSFNQIKKRLTNVSSLVCQNQTSCYQVVPGLYLLSRNT